MLDVHILTLPTSRQDWVKQCVDSVNDAAARAPFPVGIHIVEGTSGHIGKGRAHGYGLGTHAYVTCVDDDDYVLPHAFEQMWECLASRSPLAVSTPENIERNGYMVEGKQRHHLIAYQRTRIIDHTDWACCGDVRQILSIPEYGWHDLAIPGYVHRVYESSARLMRRADQDELHRALTNDQPSRNTDRLAER